MSKTQYIDESENSTTFWSNLTTWQVSIIISIIVFILFILANVYCVRRWMVSQIPNAGVRTLCMGLLIMIIVFIITGIILVDLRPQIDLHTQNAMRLSALGLGL